MNVVGCLLSLFCFVVVVGMFLLFPTIALITTAIVAVMSVVIYSQVKNSER